MSEPTDGQLAASLRLAAANAPAITNAERSAIERLAASRLEARGEISEALRNLSVAEATYRATHDLEGEASPKTGRAWDLMRRAGDKARAALEAALKGETP